MHRQSLNNPAPSTFPGLVVTLLLGFAFATVPAEERGEAQQDLRHLLVQECGSCHGLRLQGGLGSPLTPEAVADRPDEYLKTVILRGVPGTPMPPWGRRLTEEDADRLIQLMRKGVQ